MQFSPIFSTGLSSLIGPDDTVAQNTLSKSLQEYVTQPGSTSSGEILNIRLLSSGGDVLTPDGTLLILSADPEIAATASTGLTLAEWESVLATVDVAAADWKTDPDGLAAFFSAEVGIAFQPLEALFFVWLHESATSFNSDAADNESLKVEARIRKDS